MGAPLSPSGAKRAFHQALPLRTLPPFDGQNPVTQGSLRGVEDLNNSTVLCASLCPPMSHFSVPETFLMQRTTQWAAPKFAVPSAVLLMVIVHAWPLLSMKSMKVSFSNLLLPIAFLTVVTGMTGEAGRSRMGTWADRCRTALRIML